MSALGSFVFGLRRKSFIQVDGALDGLKACLTDDVLRDGCRRGTAYLYAEIHISTIDLVVMVRLANGRLIRMVPPVLLKIHLRELWTQFRIARLPMWAAVGLIRDRAGRADLAYFHADMLDATRRFEDRATRWMVRSAGAEAIEAMADFDHYADAI